MKSYLLSESDLNALLECEDLEGVSHILENTPYRDEIAVVPLEGLTSIDLEKAFTKNFLRIFDEIWEHSSKDLKILLDDILRKFEVENVKAILRAKMAELGVDEALRFIIPVRHYDETVCKSLLEKTKTVEDVVKLMAGTEYGQVLQGALKTYRETGLLIPLETALDGYAAMELWKDVHKLKGVDIKIAEEILGTEIDVLNIKIILRCKALEMDEEVIHQLILPTFYALTKEDVENGVMAIDVEDAINTLMVKDYKKWATEALKEYSTSKSVSPVEIVLDRLLLKLNQSIFIKYPSPFHIGVILAFLNLKWFELKNLRAIVTGNENKVSREKIKNVLIV